MEDTGSIIGFSTIFSSLCLQRPPQPFLFSLNAYWTLLGHLPPSYTSLVAPLLPLLASLPMYPPWVCFCSSSGVRFTSTVLLVPGHAFNYPSHPFLFTIDECWTLVRSLTLSGASPMGTNPLFSLPSHNLRQADFSPL